MEQQVITCVINGNAYKLCAADSASIKKVSSADRQLLISVLEAVQKHEQASHAAVAKAVSSASVNLTGVAAAGRSQAKPGRLGGGDVDALMARLVEEEKRKQKPGLTKKSVYKFVGGMTLLIFLLVLIF